MFQYVQMQSNVWNHALISFTKVKTRNSSQDVNDDSVVYLDWLISIQNQSKIVCVHSPYSCTSDADCVPHIHLVATGRSNPPKCIKYKMGASCSSSPFVTFSSRTCSYSLSFSGSIEDHHWFSRKDLTCGSIHYPMLLSFCRWKAGPGFMLSDSRVHFFQNCILNHLKKWWEHLSAPHSGPHFPSPSPRYSEHLK